MTSGAATVVGGGLAGCEAAWALAGHGVPVRLMEMRPGKKTPAHQTENLAEIVCSNSFKSEEITNAHGLLKSELRALGSLLLRCADEVRVPAGAALAVDREAFSRKVQAEIERHPLITVVREEASGIPSPAVIATGPLTSDALAAALKARLGLDALA
ncbi:MAG: FAD-dependent oxidoreductase, partial [Gemmatimonadales bacterium]